jgi:hypothetical protein
MLFGSTEKVTGIHLEEKDQNSGLTNGFSTMTVPLSMMY